MDVFRVFVPLFRVSEGDHSPSPSVPAPIPPEQTWKHLGSGTAGVALDI